MKFTLMVFDTIRVGFPKSEVVVHGNDLGDTGPVADACEKTGCQYIAWQPTIHHEWLTRLLEVEKEPFVIVDTDMIFFESLESWGFTTPLAGWRIPEWHDEFSGCLTRARLHTSLLYINPELVGKELANFTDKIAQTPFTPLANLIYPIVVPFKGRGVFYDTASLLYHAIGGHRFTEQILDSYAHLNFGTIPDVVIPRLKDGPEMEKMRSDILADPEKSRGLWRTQMAYYEARQ